MKKTPFNWKAFSLLSSTSLVSLLFLAFAFIQKAQADKAKDSAMRAEAQVENYRNDVSALKVRVDSLKAVINTSADSR